MTNEERNRILKMIADGKITAEEGLKLLQALESAPEEEASASATQSQPAETVEERAVESTLTRLHASARRLWHIPLWIGTGITLLSAWGMYALLVASRLNFWFYCLLAPLLLGVALIILAVASRNATWLVVDVRQKAGARPGRIFFGLPLPMKVVTWSLRTFGHNIPDLQDANLAAEVLEKGLSTAEPLIIHASDDENGEGGTVQVYLG